VIAPIFEMSLRQSLIMSDGTWMIFLQRPIAFTLLVVCAVLLAMSAYSSLMKRRDWRAELAEAEPARRADQDRQIPHTASNQRDQGGGHDNRSAPVFRTRAGSAAFAAAPHTVQAQAFPSRRSPSWCSSEPAVRRTSSRA
jgi:hypothetical protein